MSDEILEIITAALSDDFTPPPPGDAEAVVRELHAAGYTIEPEWSTDLDAAPRDGTPVRLYSEETGREYVASWMTSMEEGDGQWVYARRLEAGNGLAFVVHNPTHWKPITPPKRGHQ